MRLRSTGVSVGLQQRWRSAPLLSNDVRYPARTHLFHVVSILWIRAQEVLLDQTLDGYEPENAKTHKQRILWTVRTQQECESCQQSSGVHRMSPLASPPQAK